MPSPGPQREAPFCSKGGRPVLLIAREGNGVMGAIFPTGRRWRLWIPWAFGALAGRPDGPRRAAGDCDSVGREGGGAHASPVGSGLAEAFASGLFCPCRRWRHRAPDLPALSPSQGAAVRGKFALSAASAIPAEPRFRWETVRELVDRLGVPVVPN